MMPRKLRVCAIKSELSLIPETHRLEGEHAIKIYTTANTEHRTQGLTPFHFELNSSFYVKNQKTANIYLLLRRKRVELC